MLKVNNIIPLSSFVFSNIIVIIQDEGCRKSFLFSFLCLLISTCYTKPSVDAFDYMYSRSREKFESSNENYYITLTMIVILQALCKELTKKAADLAWENENLKRVGIHQNHTIFFL